MPAEPARRFAALLLAAGRSTRMGGASKLLADLGGMAIVRRAAEALVAGGAAPLIVVTGHLASGVAGALEGLAVRLVHNPRFADGMAGSLAAGLAAVPEGCAGVVVALGDMPLVRPADIARVLAAYDPAARREIVVPVWEGRRGHPVLWPARLLPELAAVEGDRGGRAVMARNADVLHEVAATDEGVLIDIDTPEALAEARRQLA
jgi:molybdenum cofactor cytidylyltransferase